MKSSRTLPRVECDAIPLSMALHADVAERSLALLSRPDVKQAVGAFFGLGDSCIAVEITDEGISTTLVRQGMSGDQALACLERVLALADAVFGPDDTRPRSLRSRPATRAVGDGQSPVAVPSALGSSGR